MKRRVGGKLRAISGCIDRGTGKRLLAIFFFAAATCPAQQSPSPADTTAPPVNAAPVTSAQAQPALTNDRILGVIPNFQTVEDPTKSVPPLTVKEKFELFFRESVDPFTITSAAAGAALSQAHNDDPKYGQGSGPYAQRFGAAVADVTTQNFFQDAVLSSMLHEDPRYFRRGPEFGFWYRLGYSLSRVVVGRTDQGKTTFNFANIGGMAMGIALSNTYYPDRSVSGGEVAYRFGTSMAASALSNVLPEFWPDIKQKVFHRK
jgi:hypothetical protein